MNNVTYGWHDVFVCSHRIRNSSILFVFQLLLILLFVSPLINMKNFYNFSNERTKKNWSIELVIKRHVPQFISLARRPFLLVAFQVLALPITQLLLSFDEYERNFIWFNSPSIFYSITVFFVGFWYLPASKKQKNRFTPANLYRFTELSYNFCPHSSMRNMR